MRIGTLVRVPLHGRRVGGWVVGLPDRPGTDRALQPVTRVTGWGPPADVVELARWAAWRWAGRLSALLGTASPPRAVRRLPSAPAGAGVAPPVGGDQGLAAEAFASPSSLVRLPPAGEVEALLLVAAQREDPLILFPSLGAARFFAARLRLAGRRVAVLPDQWAEAAAGGCVAVGARGAVWAPRPRLGAVLVVDEHDEAYQQEQAPTWNARDVALERARRAGVPCVLTSPCPSLEALEAAPLVALSRAEERGGWPILDVVDRRAEPPGSGLYSERLVALVRQAGPGRRVVCVLNRKGRARLLACGSCGELARCSACGSSVEQAEPSGLVCRRCGAWREGFCTACGSTRMKALRVGVTRAREELELLAGLPVAEVTAETAAGPPPAAPVLIGTEAVLHRVAGAWAVAFLDFDQELLAPRYRAAEQALGLLARAARLVGPRDGGGRVLVQTRLPDHESIDAAMHADPSRLAVAERARRAALGLPPESAVAVVSGVAAPAFVGGLEAAAHPGVAVAGPSADGRWMVKADDHKTLCDALAAVARPPGRLRVEVDPLRA